VGQTVHSRSGQDLAPHRPRRILDREEVVTLRERGLSLRQIASRLGLGLGTVVRTLQARSKSSCRQFGTRAAANAVPTDSADHS
jgi:IS30 family transposase